LADVVLWDATRLPLRAGVVDHFVSDLPFGKRLGSKADNRRLYPESLEQMRRALCSRATCTSEAAPADADGRREPGPSRAGAPLELVLLSADRHALTTAVRGARGRPWRVELQKRINVGGLDGLLLGAALVATRAPPPVEPQSAPVREEAAPTWPIAKDTHSPRLRRREVTDSGPRM